MEATRDTLIWIYTKMQTIRHFETKVEELCLQGKIPSFVHLYIGEEAVAAGVLAHLKPTDYIASNHRGHGHLIAKGGEIKRMMAELLAKSTGYCKGKGGSMHIADIDLGILGANGIVAAGIPIAVGAGFAARYKKTDGVSAVFFGDGASNHGAFHEAINMAAAWKLPVLFVCENNGYAISTSQSRSQAITNVADRAAGYGIPGVVADGNDAFAVYEAAGEAVERARSGLGPTLLEFKTYRWLGHVVGEASLYRTQEEVDAWKLKDPIPYFCRRLIEMGTATAEELAEIEKDVVGQVEEAVKYAEDSPVPPLESMLDDVYAPCAS